MTTYVLAGHSKWGVFGGSRHFTVTLGEDTPDFSHYGIEVSVEKVLAGARDLRESPHGGWAEETVFKYRGLTAEERRRADDFQQKVRSGLIQIQEVYHDLH